ncbi:MAG: TonB-dependent receptor plug domain-containing protein [Flavobacteriaceae bacterium]
MKSKTHLLLCFFLILLAGSSIGAQDRKRSLVAILSDLETVHDIQFNYASSELEDIELTPPQPDWPLRQSLDHISEEAGLDFEQLSNNIITVVRRRLALCGYLRDKDTREPLLYATISTGNSSTVSNSEGYFEIKEIRSGVLVEIRHVGYKSLLREPAFFKQDLCAEIYLVPQQQQLAEVVLYDYLVRGIDKLDNGAFRINFDHFTILPGLVENDVLQSVQAFPGIQSINETVSNINIRGGSHDQNLILWDGIKMYQSGHFFGLISMYNPQITQQVTLQKNGSPITLTDGVSGSIIMETEKEINSSARGNLGINFIDANGFADIPLGTKSSIQVAARKSISDLWETPTYSEYFKRISQETEIESNIDQVVNSDINFDFYDTSLRWLYSPSDKDKIQLNFILTNNNLGFNENALFEGEPQTRQSNIEQNSIAAGIRYERQWSKTFSSQLQVYNTDYKLKAINANILNDQRFLQENTVSETGILLNTRFQINDNLNWSNGYQFIETKVSNLDDVDNPIFRNLVGEVLRIHALFSGIDLRSANRSRRLNLGLRYNYLDKFGKSILEPRISFNQRLTRGLHLELLGEFKHQNTSQVINFQNDFLGIEKRRWQLSNDSEIPVIESRQGSAGLSYSNSGWLINAVGYYKDVNGITTQSQGFQNQYEFIRTSGNYQSKGIDFLVRKQINRLNTWLSYSYLKSDYLFDALPDMQFPSNFDITHALTAGVAYNTGVLGLSAGINWRTGKPYTTPDPVQPVIDDQINYLNANNTRLEDYLRVDISGLYEFSLGLKNRGQVGLSVWNLLDRVNPINIFYKVTPEDEAEQITETSLGITPNAVFRFYF